MSRARPAAVTPDDEQQMSLPLWPEHMRGVPKAALYSALFAPIRKGARRAVEREKIAAPAGYHITFTGWRLDQGDLDVFEQCIHQIRGQSVGAMLPIRPRELLKQIGRSNGSKNRDWLVRSLSRLQACAVEVTKEHLSYSGNLVQEFARNEETGVYQVRLNPRLVELFAQGYTTVFWQQRMQLGRKPLAQWLHGFVCGQIKPLSWDVAKLMEYAGSSYERMRDFRAAIDEAAALICEVGFDLVVLWSTDRTNVTFTRAKWKGGGTDAVDVLSLA